MGNLRKPNRDGDSPLQLLDFNEEFLVGTGHQLVPITSLPFVHTARRSYRLDDPVKIMDEISINLIYSLLYINNVYQKLSKPYYLEEGEVVTRFP